MCRHRRRPWVMRRQPVPSADQSLREFARPERPQVVQALADTDEPQGQGAGLAAIAATTPPLAVPSSLVKTSPVSPSAASNAATCARAFWPVLASRHQERLVRRAFLRLADHAADLLQLFHQLHAASASRPAVSASTMSIAARRAAAMASNITAAGSPPCCAMTCTLLRAPQASSCSRAAARERIARGEQHRRTPAPAGTSPACRSTSSCRRR